MSQYDELKKIKELLDDGALTKAEYDAQKKKILSRHDEPETAPANSHNKPATNGDAPSGGYLALGLFFPLIGLILFLVWNSEYPLRAKSAGKGALIGVIVWFVLGIIIPLIIGLIFTAVFTNSLPDIYW